MEYIPNQWYAVLLATEVKVEKPVAFRRLGQEVVFWRDNAGQVVAMDDRCPHRQVRLSLGKLADGCIECPFHGFRFDREGTCQLIPANGKNGPRPKIMRVETIPVREAHGYIWLWSGEPQTDYPPIPFYEGLENFAAGDFQRHWNLHYTRIIENQLDVAHVPFVHPDSIGAGGATVVNGPYSLVENNRLYVWADLDQDDGAPARHASQMSRPDAPWGFEFIFPNMWQLRPLDGLRLVLTFAPIDAENTMLYSRIYQNFVKVPVAGKLFSRVGVFFSNQTILRQDKRVVTTHRVKQGGLDSGDKYIPADRPILLYYNHRDKLIREAQQSRLPNLTAVKSGD
jgi:phenylpropionate dioxygenase-like ring-hydroxylating dioxygenase large terminal subunit